jgi:hypothetical protein
MWFADVEERADDALEREGLKAAIADGIRTLPERDAMVLQLYFVEEMNLDEIGQTLGVGAARDLPDQESRIGQIAPLARRVGALMRGGEKTNMVTKLSVRADELPNLLDRAPRACATVARLLRHLLWRNCLAPRDVFADLPIAGGALWPRAKAERGRASGPFSTRGKGEVAIEAIYRSLMPHADDAAIAEAVEASSRPRRAIATASRPRGADAGGQGARAPDHHRVRHVSVGSAAWAADRARGG